MLTDDDDDDKVSSVATVAAQRIARTLVESGRARQLVDAHGAGAFQATFASVDELLAWRRGAEVPQLSFCDTTATAARLGDVATGAVHRGCYDIVVVVDVVDVGLRLVMRGCDDKRPVCERVALTIAQVPVEQEARELSDERAAAINALAQRRLRTLTAGGRRHLLVVEDDEADNEDAFDIVDEADFSQFTDIDPAPPNIARLVDVWQSHDPTTHAVVWVLNVGGQRHVDSLWLAERPTD